jgi:hypothetical protein
MTRGTSGGITEPTGNKTRSSGSGFLKEEAPDSTQIGASQNGGSAA